MASKLENEIIEKAFTRCFSTTDGKKILDYLHTITYDKPVSIYASDAELRHNEGQKYLLFAINNMIKKGASQM
ncbi:MAG: hypothetical protein LBU68_02665 [Rickettsiales bacterium]|jgi:hypothetical protein|nr:hypothetical protein [Rickettsiales bacterium]